ncbi:MAG: hypothetical protein IJR00_06730 [Lachnospiraceae bacterium]|nr:hypothetical protein [Lachnospiraceae bacterium]
MSQTSQTAFHFTAFLLTTAAVTRLVIVENLRRRPGGVPTLFAIIEISIIRLREEIFDIPLTPLFMRMCKSFRSAHLGYYHKNGMRVKYFFEKMTFALFR